MRPLLMAALCSLAMNAHAAQWSVDGAQSTLTFSGLQAADPFEGRFKKFTSTIELDPEHPETGRIAVTVDMTSAVIDDKDKQDSLPTEDWFFTKQFPTATFESTAIASTGPHAYAATGKLTLRGVTQPVTLPFTLREDAGVTHAEGTVQLMRNQFGVGGGQWKTDEWVKFPVTVRFHLQAIAK